MMPCSPIHKSKDRFKTPYSPIPVPPLPAVTFDDLPVGKPPPMNPPPMNPPPSVPIDPNEQYYYRSIPIPQLNTGAVHDTKYHAKGQHQQQYHHYQQQDHHHHPQDHQPWNNNNPPPPGHFIDHHGPSDTATDVSYTTNEHTDVRFHNNNNNNNNNTHPIPLPVQTGYHDQRYLDAPLPNVPTTTARIPPHESNINQTRTTTGSCSIPIRGNNDHPNFRHDMMASHSHQQYSPLERNNTDHHQLRNDSRRPNIVPLNSSPTHGSSRMVQQPPPSTHSTLHHRHHHHHHQDKMPLIDTAIGMNIVPPGTPSPTEGHPQQQQGHPAQPQMPLIHQTLFNESVRQDFFRRLTRYKKNYGHCHVPIKYITDPELGKWTRAVRTLDKYAVPPHFRSQLESIGFYDPPPPPKNHKTAPRPFQRTSATLERQWKEMFQRVVKFKEIHGHCQVPFHYKEDPKLGYWVKNQRFKKDRLTQARHDKLEEIGFEWEVASKVQNQTWNEMFERLQKFESSHKHCFVPSRYKEDPKLGSWVHRQRHLKDKLPADRRAKLDSIGFL